MSHATKMLVLGTMMAVLTSGTAFADRKPTLEERTRIETKLKESGFTSWDEIEFDENRDQWEIDDARASDGKSYDLKLRPQTFEIISRRLDD